MFIDDSNLHCRPIDGIIYIWDRKFGQRIGALSAEDHASGQTIDSVIWNQRTALMAVAYSKGSVKIYHIPSILDENLTAARIRANTGLGGGGNRGGRWTPSPRPTQSLPLPRDSEPDPAPSIGQRTPIPKAPLPLPPSALQLQLDAPLAPT